ncbi:MAG: cation transporter [Ruminococcaceae bacterium]|nr:cation transporter [Oscillospiraceae bacterium]
MKTEKTMLTAFLLNTGFSLLEFVGGVFTGSAAILSDAVHDLIDALGIALAYWFERKSKRAADDRYTFGYARYTVLGGLVTALLLLIGSAAVIVHAIGKLREPSTIHYDGMLIFAVLGIAVNGVAALLTHRGESFNQKAVFWHLLEDVLGWVAVLVAAVVIRLTDWVWIDPLLSIALAVFIGIHAIGHLKEGAPILLEASPLDTKALRESVQAAQGVVSVERLYVWSTDGEQTAVMLCLTADGDLPEVKERVKQLLCENGIGESAVEITVAENVRTCAENV